MVVDSLDAVRAELRRMLPDLSRRYGVLGLWIFGSHARGSARPDSDLDLMVDVAVGALSLWDFIGLEQEIGDRLGMKVDIVDRRALRPEIAPFVLPETVPV